MFLDDVNNPQGAEYLLSNRQASIEIEQFQNNVFLRNIRFMLYAVESDDN